MSRGGMLPIVAGVICVGSVACAIIFNLWRPVFISTALFGFLLLLVAVGSGPLVRKISDLCGEIAVRIGKAVSWLIMVLIIIIMFDVVTRKIQ